MTVILGYAAVNGVVGMRDAIDLLERAAAHEAAGKTSVSPRLHADFENGWMRILCAADSAAGYCASKAYHLVEGAGVRYVVSLYSLRNGELLALIDGRVITDLRTGAASGVVARKVPLAAPVTVGIIGSGNQARAQLESLATVYPIAAAAVYSPTPAHRNLFAREMTARLGFPVTAVNTAQDAVRGRRVVATASSHKSSEPIVRGAWLDGCRLLCAVGNTRRQFAEVDAQCFADAALVVMDAPHAVEETGDLAQAQKSGVLPVEKRATLAQLVAGSVAAPQDRLVVFKSVGTALQDLALAARYYELLGSNPGLPAAHDLASLRAK